MDNLEDIVNESSDRLRAMGCDSFVILVRDPDVPGTYWAKGDNNDANKGLLIGELSAIIINESISTMVNRGILNPNLLHPDIQDDDDD